MRAVLLVLTLAAAGCGRGFEPKPDIFFDSGFEGDPGLLCLHASPDTVTLLGGLEVEARTPAEVLLSTPEDCVEPAAHVEDVGLDDPSGAFRVGDWEPGEVRPDSPMQLQVHLVATEPGTYEGQLLVSGVTFGQPQVRAVQLFGRVEAE